MGENGNILMSKRMIDARRAICTSMLVSVIVCAAYGIFYTTGTKGSLISTLSSSVFTDGGAATAVNIALIELCAVAMTMLAWYEFRSKQLRARYMARTLVPLMVGDILANMTANGITPIVLFIAFQLLCIIVYQVLNDPNIVISIPHPGFLRSMRGHRELPESKRPRFMPLNVFNIFWTFAIASFLGLVIETIYHLGVFGEWQDRAGVLWGPFSPIYGFGAVLLTVALNRFWNKPLPVIFLVGATIGAAFEFFVSWYMEVSFGIIAWDYTGTFLSIAGRTNFFFWCCWGILSVAWMRMFLPTMMRVIDAIPIGLRAAVTAFALALMLFDGGATLLALDAWGKRNEDMALVGVERIVSDAFDDEYMEKRFETMSFLSE